MTHASILGREWTRRKGVRVWPFDLLSLSSAKESDSARFDDRELAGAGLGCEPDRAGRALFRECYFDPPFIAALECGDFGPVGDEDQHRLLRGGEHRAVRVLAQKYPRS